MIQIEIGQKVIFRNGITGRIKNYDSETGKVTVKLDEAFEIFKYADNSEYDTNDPKDLRHFYLLGKNLFKNKVDEEEIETLKENLSFYKKTSDALRKALFNINERMVDDWRERQGKKDT